MALMLEVGNKSTNPTQLSPVHRDACLRILHLNRQNHKEMWEQAHQIQNGWMESFLYLRLVVNFSSDGSAETDGGGNHSNDAQERTLVYRDFIRLYQQMGPALNPSALVPAARNVLDNLKRVEDQNLKDFLEGSLERLVAETTFMIDCIQDWTRLWDIVGGKFVVPFAIGDIPGQDETPTVATYSSLQAQRLAWTLTCIRAHHLQLKHGTNDGDDDDANRKQRRRERLLAGCGALAFLTALYESTIVEEADDEIDRTEPPHTKKVRFETIGMTLAEFIYNQSKNADQARLTRFGTCSSAIPTFDPTITASEIDQEVEAVAKMIWKYTAESGDLKPWEAVEEAGPSPSRYRRIPWIRQLECTPFVARDDRKQCVTVHQIVVRLAMTVGSLYEENLLASATLSDDYFVYDEATLIELDSLLPLDDGRETRIMEYINRKIAGSARVVTPPIFTEAMEVNEWTVSLLYLDVVKPSQKLRRILDVLGWKNTIIPILNRILLRLSQEMLTENKKPSRVAPVMVEDNGHVTLVERGGGDPSPSSPEKQLCKAVVAVYYHSLEAILVCEKMRLDESLESQEKTYDILKSHVVQNAPFHTALMACCILCVNKAIGVTQKISPLIELSCLSVLHICDCQPQDFLKVAESFQKSLTGNTSARGKLGSPLVFDLPRMLWKEVNGAEMKILDTFMWKQDSRSLVERIDELKSKQIWPPESLAPDSDDDDQEVAQADPTSGDHDDYLDFRSLSYIFRRVLKLAYRRILTMLEFLNVHSHRAIVAPQVFVALRYLLRHHTEMLYDRHLDHMILCCIYGVCKTLKYITPEVTFTKLIDAYVVVRGQEVGDITCQRVVRHIKLIHTAENAEHAQHHDEPSIGNIIQLYNLVFVPNMKDHLLNNESLQRAAAKLKAGHDGKEGCTQLTMGEPGKLLQEKIQEGGTIRILEFGKASQQGGSVVGEQNDEPEQS